MKSFGNNEDEWTFEIGKESEKGAVCRGGKTTEITLTHKDNGLVATVEATIYEESASCEWTVFIKNTAEEKSPVISKLFAADCTLPTGRKTEIFYSKGSEPANDDFELLQSGVFATPLRFNANSRALDWALVRYKIAQSLKSLPLDCAMI